MGIGDNIMASALARGFADRGKKAAFGSGPGDKIRWDGNSEVVFRGNPNIARPGEEHLLNLEWVKFYKGHRMYNTQDAKNKRWVWHDFHPQPGEFFFSEREWTEAKKWPRGFVLIEPNVPWQKGCAANKDWGFDKYQIVAHRLRSLGHGVFQFTPVDPRGRILEGVYVFPRSDFRTAAARLSQAAVYVGTEGGLHHAAAAVDVRAVVLFGGFIHPKSTGYSGHFNLTGSTVACGKYDEVCAHCRAAMDEISVEVVTAAALVQLARYKDDEKVRRDAAECD